MAINQKSLCIFLHYSKFPRIPHYVRIYLHELSQHFDLVLFVANSESDREEEFFSEKNISTMLVKNEGYDLGMFHKAFLTIDPNEFSQIACINDSNILFNKLQPIFNWSKNHSFDFWGLIDSHEIPWFSSHPDSYHIQSHFIVFNRKAIEKLPDFFKTLDFDRIYNEKDTAKLRQTVINNWEIGLSRFLISKGLIYGSYIDSQLFAKDFSSGKKINITHKLYPELIRAGYPLIKKKVISRNRWKDSLRLVLPWEKMIRQYGNHDWDIELLIDELNKMRDDSGNPTLVKFRKKFQGTINSFGPEEVA